MKLRAEVEKLQLQSARDVAHQESERDVRADQSQRVLANTKSLEYITKMIEDHDRVLYNGGAGFVVTVATMQQEIRTIQKEIKTEKDANNNNLYKWLAIISLLVSLVSAIAGFFR